MISPNKQYQVALSIAGLDPSGGAGILADLKTFSALNAYGMAVLTASTAQNTRGVQSIHPIPTPHIQNKLQALLDDIHVDAVKTGMLHSAKIIQITANFLRDFKLKNIVVDPVMVGNCGRPLLREDAINALKKDLIPLASIITPNIPEAEVLLNMPIKSLKDMQSAILDLAALGPKSVILKGGHLIKEKRSTDVLLIDNKIHLLESPRIPTKHTHGTGCTFSSAIAANLANNLTLLDATKKAKDYIHNAIQSGAHFQLGSGYGPVNHFHNVW